MRGKCDSRVLLSGSNVTNVAMTTAHLNGESLKTSIGAIQYRELGYGDPLLFVHGFFVNGALWNSVVSRLPATMRLIIPDFPLGGHHIPVHPDADLRPPALANLLLEIIELLDLRNLTLIGNDTGGAMCQIAVTSGDQRAGRIQRLVLTNCDAFEYFPAPSFLPIQEIGRTNPARVFSFVATPEGRQTVLRSVATLDLSDKGLCELFGGLLYNDSVRHDAIKVLLGMCPEYTIEAASRFNEFEKPVQLIWGLNDEFSPVQLAERLQEAFPHAALTRVPNAKLFVPLDQPLTVAEAIRDFARREDGL